MTLEFRKTGLRIMRLRRGGGGQAARVDGQLVENVRSTRQSQTPGPGDGGAALWHFGGCGDHWQTVSG